MHSPIALVFVFLASATVTLCSGRTVIGLHNRDTVEPPTKLKLATRAQIVRRSRNLPGPSRVTKRQASPVPQVFEACPGSTSQGFATYAGLNSLGSDVDTISSPSLDSCLDFCATNKVCVGIVWQPPQGFQSLGPCYLKSAIQPSSAIIAAPTSILALKGGCASHVNDMPAQAACCNA